MVRMTRKNVLALLFRQHRFLGVQAETTARFGAQVVLAPRFWGSPVALLLSGPLSGRSG